MLTAEVEDYGILIKAYHKVDIIHYWANIVLNEFDCG